uniref:Uncharacterized protein n=1 Tax=Coccidioides posadasii RMSCC 3488 TaxID=454284 RepID=A0A0J6F811_COCPO|nr:hypothetical protein CPAG_05429 [Coccidioides posadasii RMSCC 3488]
METNPDRAIFGLAPRERSLCAAPKKTLSALFVPRSRRRSRNRQTPRAASFCARSVNAASNRIDASREGMCNLWNQGRQPNHRCSLVWTVPGTARWDREPRSRHLLWSCGSRWGRKNLNQHNLWSSQNAFTDLASSAVGQRVTPRVGPANEALAGSEPQRRTHLEMFCGVTSGQPMPQSPPYLQALLAPTI